jgi:hypothetical protein
MADVQKNVAALAVREQEIHYLSATFIEKKYRTMPQGPRKKFLF